MTSPTQHDRAIIHLVGLHAALNLGIPPIRIPPFLQRLVARVDRWPHFKPPQRTGPLSVFQVALAESPEEHVARVRKWATRVWEAWSHHHAAVAELAKVVQNVVG